MRRPTSRFRTPNSGGQVGARRASRLFVLILYVKVDVAAQYRCCMLRWSRFHLSQKVGFSNAALRYGITTIEQGQKLAVALHERLFFRPIVACKPRDWALGLTKEAHESMVRAMYKWQADLTHFSEKQRLINIQQLCGVRPFPEQTNGKCMYTRSTGEQASF